MGGSRNRRGVVHIGLFLIEGGMSIEGVCVFFKEGMGEVSCSLKKM